MLNSTLMLQTKDEKLHSLNNLRFKILVREENKKFYLQIPELSMVVVGETLSEAYIDLAKEKNKYFNTMIDLNQEDEVVLLSQKEKFHFNMTELKSSLIKQLVMFGLIIATLGIGSCTARNVVVSGVAKLPEIFRSESAKFNEKIDKSANYSEEKKSMKIERFKKLMSEIKPYIQVVKDAFKEDTK